MEREEFMTKPGEVPITDTFDLHAFRPEEIKDLLKDYLSAGRERGILEVRIIHGKGTGCLRRTVHALLRKLPEVAYFHLAGNDAGGWGATLIELKPQPRSD